MTSANTAHPLATYTDLELMRHLASRIPSLGALRLYLASVDPGSLTVDKKRRIVAMIERAMTRSD
jgi:hypothetical protein